jgi:predicted RecA/RadA family phage recombinase
MAKNYIQEGDQLSYTAGGTAIVSGAVVLMGKRIGIAIADIPANSQGTVSATGVWSVAKLGTDAVGQGDLLYWDAANSRLTTTAAGNTQAGYAAAAAGAGVATVNIKING